MVEISDPFHARSVGIQRMWNVFSRCELDMTTVDINDARTGCKFREHSNRLSD